jgi:hypothetical protein
VVARKRREWGEILRFGFADHDFAAALKPGMSRKFAVGGFGNPDAQLRGVSEQAQHPSGGKRAH